MRDGILQLLKSTIAAAALFGGWYLAIVSRSSAVRGISILFIAIGYVYFMRRIFLQPGSFPRRFLIAVVDTIVLIALAVDIYWPHLSSKEKVGAGAVLLLGTAFGKFWDSRSKPASFETYRIKNNITQGY
jgi:hypothetical protein